MTRLKGLVFGDENCRDAWCLWLERLELDVAFSWRDCRYVLWYHWKSRDHKCDYIVHWLVVFFKVDKISLQFGQDLKNLSLIKKLVDFKLLDRKLFGKYQALGMGAEKWHFLDHLAENFRHVGAVSHLQGVVSIRKFAQRF